MPPSRPTSLALTLRGDPSRVGTVDADPGTDPVIAEARARWKKCDEAEQAQRRAIVEAKKFRAGDQWPDAIKQQRQGAQSIAGVAAQPPRPCLTIDRLSQPVRQLSNAIRSQQFSIDVMPNGFGADDDTATMLKGYCRFVQNAARLDSPIEWAADQAIEGGIGWFRLRTDYIYEAVVDADDPAAFDQTLKLERIANNLSVYADPFAQTPTKRDMAYAFVTEDLDRDDFKARYQQDIEGDPVNLQSLDDFCSTGDLKDWASPETVRVAEYWRVRTVTTTVTVGPQSRTVRTKTVEGFKITASQVLERWQWLGTRIPLFPVIGEELNLDGKQRVRGVIEEGMDAQRMLNYTYSGAVETFALAPKSPFVAAAGQIDNYRDQWMTANTVNWSVLTYDPVTIAGAAVPAPERQTSEPPIQAAVALMQRSEEAIKACTGVYDPSLEYNNPREHSGTAIGMLQQQSQATSDNYSLNVQRILIDVGEQIVAIAPKLTRPGQILHILGMDDVPQQVMVGVPFVRDPQGRAQPAQPDQIAQQLHEFYDPSKGTYGVTVTVGQATATQREEGVQGMMTVAKFLPPEMSMVMAPEIVEALSFPGSHAIAEKLRKALPPQLQDQDQQNQGPQQLALLQQQNQQLQQQLQQLGQLADKNRTDLLKTQMQEQSAAAQAALDRQTQLEKAELQASATMSVAQAKVDAENFRSYVDALESRVSKLLDLHMQKQTQQMAQLHEHLQGVLDKRHDVGMANLEHTHALREAAQAGQIARQAAVQQAALNPPTVPQGAPDAAGPVGPQSGGGQ